METINIRVLDYYNKPGYYHFMSNELFAILEQAFLDDKEYSAVPKHLYDDMVDKLNSHLAVLETAAIQQNPNISVN